MEAVYVSYPGYASVAPLFVGQSEQFRATVGFTSGAGGSCPQQIAWRSSDPAVALVTPDGVARMLTPGSVSISATCSGVTGTANVGVYRPVTFSGTVRDPQGGPLSGVSVWVRTAGKFGASATTDSAGRFFIARVPQGVAAPVSVSKTGYRPLSIGPLPFSADSTMDFTLERQ